MAMQRPTRLVLGPCIVEIDLIVIRDVQYKFEVIQCRNEEVNFQGSSANRRTDGRTDAHHHNIPTFSPKNLASVLYRRQPSMSPGDCTAMQTPTVRPSDSGATMVLEQNGGMTNDNPPPP
ncbi:hypothetical protein DPMN_104033 [Dreissena polymorpha]|uniref:Uncharacterized protein n=1 Tax=Dreissena polymorpha TaxID=45954 RepID=A0A9D4JZP9_DREPO|nr:hypothetical protein DPMN_104033 [Dreissena polymorpha]